MFAGLVGTLLVSSALVYAPAVLAQSDENTFNDDGTVTYIIRAHAGSAGLSVFSDQARALNTGYIAKELSENVDGTVEVHALRKSGFVMAHTYNNEKMEEALNRIYGVDGWEKSRNIYQIDSKANTVNPIAYDPNQPESFVYGPWLRDLEGFKDEDQGFLTPNDGYDEGGTATTASDHPSVKVAVIDTGAKTDSPYLLPGLAYNMREAQNGPNGVDEDFDSSCAQTYVDDIWGWNTTNNSADVTENGTDHGSHVSGIVKTIKDQAAAMSGTLGGPSYTDAGHRVEILPIRFISDSMVGSTEAAIKAIDYARCRKAKVINASWGAAGKDSFAQSLYDAFVDAYNDDIFIAVAAGNAEGAFPNDNDKNPYFPASYDIPSLMTVASVTAEYYRSGGVDRLLTNGLSDFSNYGANSVDVAAPGGYKSSNGDSSGIYSVNAHPENGGGLYIRKKGTSMATPVVSGIAGVVRAINNNLTAYETEQVIEKSVIKMDSLGSKVRTGGYVNARKAFDLAAATVSAHLKPALPAQPYQTYAATTQSATSSASKKGGGCGAITAPGGTTGGPFGGNSLGLFSTVYFLALLAKRFKRHLNSHRV